MECVGIPASPASQEAAAGLVKRAANLVRKSGEATAVRFRVVRFRVVRFRVVRFRVVRFRVVRFRVVWFRMVDDSSRSAGPGPGPWPASTTAGGGARALTPGTPLVPLAVN